MRKQKQRDHFAGSMLARGMAPCMISALGLAAADMADAVVIGRRMGETGLAAVSLSLPVFMVINLFMHGFGSGGSIRFARLLGEGQEKEAQKSFSMVMETAVAMGILLAIVERLLLPELLGILGAPAENPELYQASRTYVQIIVMGTPLFFISYILQYYLRNDDLQRLAGFGFTVGNGADILLNILLVLVLHQGVAGAAWATLAGQLITIFIFLAGLCRETHHLRFSFQLPRPAHVFSCFRVGLASSVQYVFQMVFLLIANNSLVRMGQENGVAVFDLLQNASYLVIYLYDGVSKAAQPLISTFAGEHNLQGRQRTVSLSYRWGTCAGAAAVLFLALFPHTVCSLFGLTDPQAVELGVRALRIYSVGALFAGASILTEYFYQACENEKPAFVIASLRGAVVLIPCTVLFSFLGLEAFWWLFPATEILSFFLFVGWVRCGRVKMDQMDQSRVFSRTINGGNQDIGRLTDEMEAFCEQWEASMEQTYFCIMAAEEVCLSIINKGFGQEEEGYIQVTLVAMEEGSLELHIRDNAVSFNPFSLETGQVSEKEEYDMDAMGIYVIKQKAKDFFYRRYQGFNSLVVKI